MRTGIAVLHGIYVYIYTFTTVYQFWFACTYFAFFPQLSGVRLKLKVDAPTKLIFMTTDFCIRERELVNKARGKVTLKHLLEWRVNRNLRSLIPLRVKHYPSALIANYLRWVPDVVLIETDKQSVLLSLRQNHTPVKNARIKQNWMSLMWNCLLSRNFIEYRLKHSLARRLEPKWRLKSMNETIDLFTVLAHNSCNPLITILSLRRIFFSSYILYTWVSKQI